VFNRRNQQRCVLQAVRTTLTARWLGCPAGGLGGGRGDGDGVG